MQLLVCLRMLIRRCVYDNVAKDDIQKLFPQEVLPELQRLLTLLLQKFQLEWRNDVLKDKVLLYAFLFLGKKKLSSVFLGSSLILWFISISCQHEFLE